MFGCLCVYEVITKKVKKIESMNFLFCCFVVCFELGVCYVSSLPSTRLWFLRCPVGKYITLYISPHGSPARGDQ